VVKGLFWLVLLVPPLLMMGTCAGLPRFIFSEDVEVAMGAALFGVEALSILSAIWLVGVPVMGMLVLLTRGKLLVLEQPPPAA
jgi:hypothetical protein